jgi:hypothetical protein
VGSKGMMSIRSETDLAARARRLNEIGNRTGLTPDHIIHQGANIERNGSALPGLVSHDLCRDAIQNLRKRPQDSPKNGSHASLGDIGNRTGFVPGHIIHKRAHIERNGARLPGLIGHDLCRNARADQDECAWP